MINSMTPQGAPQPGDDQRLAQAADRRRLRHLQVQDLNRLLKQHKQMQKMMKKDGKKGGMQNLASGMPKMPYR